MTKKLKKTAIVHDVFIEQGGAERVLLSLIEMYPDADIFVPLISKTGFSLLRSRGVKKITDSFINHLPFVHSASFLIKPLLYLYWENLDLNEYDLVISSSHSFSSKSVITSPDTLHVSYIHTPPRYLYTEFNETRILKKPFFKFIFLPLLSWLRQVDYISAQRPDILIANSAEVQRRIKKYYRRDSLIIHPPIKKPNFKKTNNKKEYYLCFSRLAKQKNIELAVLACNDLKRNLIIVGDGSEKENLMKIANSNVKFLGRVPDKDLPDIFSKARAMIYPSINEDFGMAPVEAMTYGLPIIGAYSGGVKDFLRDSINGISFTDLTVSGLKKAILRFEKTKIASATCIKTTKPFLEQNFKIKFSKIIKKYTNEN